MFALIALVLVVLAFTVAILKIPAGHGTGP
jgi:hypothetical protein